MVMNETSSTAGNVECFSECYRWVPQNFSDLKKGDIMVVMSMRRIGPGKDLVFIYGTFYLIAVESFEIKLGRFACGYKVNSVALSLVLYIIYLRTWLVAFKLV